MTGSTPVGTALPVTWSLYSTRKQPDYSSASYPLVLSCPWEPHLTVELWVSQSLSMVAGGVNTSVTVSLSPTGWREQLSLYDSP
jgi:hypothetical protein